MEQLFRRCGGHFLKKSFCSSGWQRRLFRAEFDFDPWAHDDGIIANPKNVCYNDWR